MLVLYTKVGEESLLTLCYSCCRAFAWRIYSAALSLSCLLYVIIGEQARVHSESDL